MVRLTPRQLEKAIRDGRLQEKTEQALNAAILTVTGQMFELGYLGEAQQIRDQWDNKYHAMFLDYRNIADHPEAWAWLKTVHDTVETIIGIDMCIATHFHALYIWNKTWNVVFHPKTVDELEYQKCFSGKVDTEVLYGFTSELDYWLSYLACVGFTEGLGTGWVSVCGFVGALSEFAYCHLLGGPLSDFIWEKANN